MQIDNLPATTSLSIQESTGICLAFKGPLKLKFMFFTPNCLTVILKITNEAN